MSWEDGDGIYGPSVERGLGVAQRWTYGHLLATDAEMDEMAFKIELGWGTPRADARAAMTGVLVDAVRGD